MSGTSARLLAKLQHEKVAKDNAVASIMDSKTILPPHSAAILEYYEPLASIAAKIEDRSQLDRLVGSLKSDIEHIDGVRQRLVLNSVGRGEDEHVARSRQLQASLEQVLRTLSRILSQLTSAHLHFFLTQRNLATLNSKKLPETDGLDVEEELPTSIVPDVQKKNEKT